MKGPTPPDGQAAAPETQPWVLKRRSWPLRYGVAVAAVASGLAVLSLPRIGGSLADILFFAVLVAAWYGGLGPGLLTTGLMVVTAVTTFILQGRDFPPTVVVQVALFIAGGVVISVMVEALHTARRRLGAVLTSIGEAVIATDGRGRVTFANPVAAALTGWTTAEAAGRPLDEVYRTVSESTRTPLESPVMRVLRNNSDVASSDHTLLIARDGSERPIQDGAAPIRDSAGATVGAVLVFRDDTQRRNYERELIDASRRKDEFLAMLAHEFRNPLGSIKSAVALLGTPEASQHLPWAHEVLDRQVGHLARLLDDLLDVARIARGRVTLQTELVDAAAAIERAVESVRPLIDERGHQVDVAIAGGPKWIEADPVRLEQVLVNLLNNAAKYTPPGGQIRLSADRDGEDVVLQVEDSGPGISPEILPRIFEAFAQGERPPDRSAGGLGLGLAIVKGLVELHGGRVEARSIAPGQGTVFVVRMPMAKGPSVPTGSPAPVASPSADRARILIIDDNKDLARALSRLLRHVGHEVELAHDGPEGIAAARAYSPEVLLLDIGLPNLDGYEVARQLRREEGFRQSLFIAISGYGQEEDRRRSQDAGIDHHLIKPVDVGTIISLIAQPRTPS